ncbi:MAG: S-layer homology domain-containing protein [Butyricicoccus sp.]
MRTPTAPSTAPRWSPCCGGPWVSLRWADGELADVPADSYYAQAVAWAVENGITTGVGGGRFDPTATCTRGQIATFLYRLYLSR